MGTGYQIILQGDIIIQGLQPCESTINAPFLIPQGQAVVICNGVERLEIISR
jgi:hypothetical protein